MKRITNYVSTNKPIDLIYNDSYTKNDFIALSINEDSITFDKKSLKLIINIVFDWYEKTNCKIGLTFASVKGSFSGGTIKCNNENYKINIRNKNEKKVVQANIESVNNAGVAIEAGKKILKSDMNLKKSGKKKQKLKITTKSTFPDKKYTFKEFSKGHNPEWRFHPKINFRLLDEIHAIDTTISFDFRSQLIEGCLTFSDNNEYLDIVDSDNMPLNFPKNIIARAIQKYKYKYDYRTIKLSFSATR